MTTAGYQLGDESAQFSPEAASSSQVDEEVTRIVRHAELLDDHSYDAVRVVAGPGGVRVPLALGHGRIAFREAQKQHVADGDGQRGGNEEEGDGE